MHHHLHRHQEEAIRHWATTLGYRMDLAAARSGDAGRVERERTRFLRALAPMIAHEGPKLLVTDSQVLCGLLGQGCWPWCGFGGVEGLGVCVVIGCRSTDLIVVDMVVVSPDADRSW